MNTDKFFENPEEFKNNPVNFIAHRMFNVPTYTDLLLAVIKLEQGDVEGCKDKIEGALLQLSALRDFIVKFGKEYQEEIISSKPQTNFYELHKKGIKIAFKGNSKLEVLSIEIDTVLEQPLVIIDSEGSKSFHCLDGKYFDDGSNSMYDLIVVGQ